MGLIFHSRRKQRRMRGLHRMRWKSKRTQDNSGLHAKMLLIRTISSSIYYFDSTPRGEHLSLELDMRWETPIVQEKTLVSDVHF